MHSEVYTILEALGYMEVATWFRREATALCLKFIAPSGFVACPVLTEAMSSCLYVQLVAVAVMGGMRTGSLLR